MNFSGVGQPAPVFPSAMKRSNMKTFILMAVLAVISYQQSHAGKPPDAVSTLKVETEAVQVNTGQQYYKWMDSCLMTLYPNTWVDTVVARPKYATSLFDNCVLLMIDSLEAGITDGACLRCMEALNAVADVSDGYVGEYLTEVSGNLYNNVFEPFIQFIANPKYNSTDLVNYLVFSFYLDISDADLPEQRRAEILSDIQKKKQAAGRTDAQKRILSKIAKMVKEKKDWD